MPRIPPPIPVLYKAVAPLSGIFTYTIHPQPLNTPFSGLNLKVGKLNYHLGNLDPNWAKCLKSGQLFYKWAKIFI